MLAKVGAYGFLRVVLPLFPDATVEFQEVILVIALASILYGSVMAFTQTNVRLIAGYSSVAQLGFITAGIFALRADGADGAILQMVNHGLVVAPLFVIVAILVERTGTEDLREMGGMALRAPVLAALFLIVTLATLAMPGLGQLHRRVLHPQRPLPGEDRLRLRRDHRRRDVGLLRAAPLPARRCTTASPRASPRVRSAGATASSSAPLVLCILGLALYPQLILQRTAPTPACRTRVDVAWISGLGVDYSLGIDGLNLFLILLTAVLWVGGIAFAAFREQERPQLFFFLMLVAETATLGSFLAQDLLLFVLFFDFMLVPFYFLFGSWGSDREGGPTAAAATLKMMIYTLIGSLLMLVAAIAAAIISADGGHLTFSIAAIQQQGLDVDSQRWIFWFFAAAFLVKMPAFLLHGWMPDAYRAAPLPVLVVFSGVLAKVGAYGFLRVVLPLFPDATVEFQEVILVIALASILYGSVMAFTQTNVRLIAGYSSVAQLGFITAGIFALRADGADGAILQMVNHGLVVAPLFVIVAILVERTGTEDIREMGGMALRAPVLAALFLIVALATLAMPGLGQLHRRVLHPQRPLPGEDRLRLHRDQRRRDVGLLRAAPLPARDAQPQAGRDRLARDRLRDGVVLAPLVLCILALALYPQLILHRTAPTVQQTVASVTGGDAPEAQLASGRRAECRA